MKEYALIGRPLGHSFSADYFNSGFERDGEDARYYLKELSDLSQLPSLFSKHPDLIGFNVTIPYKQQILPYLNSLTDEAREIGAVNAVKVEHPDKGNPSEVRLTGHNTDCEGFTIALKEALRKTGISPLTSDGHSGKTPEGSEAVPDKSTETHDKEEVKEALVLGTGGASCAAKVALQRLGYNVRRVSRTPGHGDLPYDALRPEDLYDSEIIVNATPAGMYPHINTAPPLPFQYLRGRGQLCFDMVYNPAKTLFMKICEAHGCSIEGGLGMLHAQAEAARRFWNTDTDQAPRQE